MLWASEPEIYVKEGPYNPSAWSQGEDSGLEESVADSTSQQSQEDRATPDSNAGDPPQPTPGVFLPSSSGGDTNDGSSPEHEAMAISMATSRTDDGIGKSRKPTDINVQRPMHRLKGTTEPRGSHRMQDESKEDDEEAESKEELQDDYESSSKAQTGPPARLYRKHRHSNRTTGTSSTAKWVENRTTRLRRIRARQEDPTSISVTMKSVTTTHSRVAPVDDGGEDNKKSVARRKQAPRQMKSRLPVHKGSHRPPGVGDPTSTTTEENNNPKSNKYGFSSKASATWSEEVDDDSSLIIEKTSIKLLDEDGHDADDDVGALVEYIEGDALKDDDDTHHEIVNFHYLTLDGDEDDDTAFGDYTIHSLLENDTSPMTKDSEDLFNNNNHEEEEEDLDYGDSGYLVDSGTGNSYHGHWEEHEKEGGFTVKDDEESSLHYISNGYPLLDGSPTNPNDDPQYVGDDKEVPGGTEANGGNEEECGESSSGNGPKSDLTSDSGVLVDNDDVTEKGKSSNPGSSLTIEVQLKELDSAKSQVEETKQADEPETAKDCVETTSSAAVKEPRDKSKRRRSKSSGRTGGVSRSVKDKSYIPRGMYLQRKAANPSMRRTRSDGSGLAMTDSVVLGAGRNFGSQKWSLSNADLSSGEWEILTEKDRLLLLLEKMKVDRRLHERHREELLRRAKMLQSRANQRREQIRDVWRKRYMEVKKITPRLEEECSRLRQELEKLHRELLAKVQAGVWALLTISGKTERPSNKLSYKIMIARLLQEIEDLTRRVEGTRLKLTTEMKLRNQAEKDVKSLREELLKKKIQVTLTRNQEQAAFGASIRDQYFISAV